MANENVTIRPIDFERDAAPLKTFLSQRDSMRLDHMQSAVRDGDGFIFVADNDGTAVGWAAVHVNYRDDQDWDPDPQGKGFQQGDNAYMENIEVAARMRSHGLGQRLLQAVQEEAKRRGKKTLWLHTNENNAMAHRMFEREGWTHDSSLSPPWKPAIRMRIYKKEL